MWLTPVLILIGVAGGILTGLLGIGSGIIYVFILPYALQHFGIGDNLLAQYIIANSFFGMAFASLSASITNFFHKDVYWKESLYVSIPGAFVAILLHRTVVVMPWYSFDLFSILLIGFLLFILVSYHIKKGDYPVRYDLSSGVLVLSGFTAGSLSSLTGLGGGGILIPILSFRFHMDIKKAKSISLIMIFLVSSSLTIINLLKTPVQSYATGQTGYVFFPVALPLSLGVILGSPAGVKLSHWLSSRTISIIFSLLILVVIAEKLVQLF
jgi:uncharacterized membrane protein YfcA